jgi:hypothetical protein
MRHCAHVAILGIAAASLVAATHCDDGSHSGGYQLPDGSSNPCGSSWPASCAGYSYFHCGARCECGGSDWGCKNGQPFGQPLPCGSCTPPPGSCPGGPNPATGCVGAGSSGTIGFSCSDQDGDIPILPVGGPCPDGYAPHRPLPGGPSCCAPFVAPPDGSVDASVAMDGGDASPTPDASDAQNLLDAAAADVDAE